MHSRVRVVRDHEAVPPGGRGRPVRADDTPRLEDIAHEREQGDWCDDKQPCAEHGGHQTKASHPRTYHARPLPSRNLAPFLCARPSGFLQLRSLFGMTPRQALQAIPLWAKVGGVGLAIAGGGMVFGQKWAGLPAQVQSHSQAIAANTVAVRTLARADTAIDDKLDRIICLLRLPEDVRVQLPANPVMSEVCSEQDRAR